MQGALSHFAQSQAVAICFALSLVLAHGFHLSAGVKLPAFQNVVVFLVMALVFLVSRKQPKRTSTPWWVYAAMLLTGVCASYLVTTAARKTGVFAASIVQVLAIPLTLAMCAAVHGDRYKWKHVLGAFIAVAGAAFAVQGSNRVDYRGAHASRLHHAYGCGLAVAAGVMFSAFLVFAQWTVKGQEEGGIREALRLLGMGGSLLSGAQVLLLEQRDVMAIDSNSGTWSSLFAHALVMLLLYHRTFQLLQTTDAVVVSLSMTAGLGYASLLMLVAYGTPVDSLIWSRSFWPWWRPCCTSPK